MRCGVYEVRQGDQRSGETNCWAIESRNKDFRVGVESIRYFEVVRYEAFERITPYIGAFNN